MTDIKIGQRYHIREWDDSLDVVEVIDRPFDQFGNGRDVLMRYPDGVAHRVTERYFRSLVTELN